LLGQSLTWRPPWTADFLLIFVRVRLVCGWRLGAGSRQPLASKSTLFVRTVVRLVPVPHQKNLLDGTMPSLSRITLENDPLGAGVVRARPPHNYAWLRQNLVRANFAASKNKKENFQRI